MPKRCNDTTLSVAITDAVTQKPATNQRITIETGRNVATLSMHEMRSHYLRY